ncbi:hypothetical protein E2C01_008228 [Portunus trituberculatus]|uniref:BZIP domain-containing protein n=1 Tax=Portunus trituberculatus TaxID=210409 RepID=A0A5B7D480_PORTR|nr:hypothetical protein [Portunus trituberculatus]
MAFSLTLLHISSPCLTLLHPASPCFTFHHPASRYITLLHTTSPHFTLHDPASLFFTLLCHPASLCLLTANHTANINNGPKESLSEEDAGTPSGTLERGQQAPWSGSSGRKQRSAAFKAARQAELKR